MKAEVIHLDTGFLIRALIHGSAEDTELRRWLIEKRPIEMSAVAWAEFLCGPINRATSSLASSIVRRQVPFTDATAQLAAKLFNDSGRRRGSMIDCMIAATAIAEAAALATTNPRDFSRFEPLGVETL